MTVAVRGRPDHRVIRRLLLAGFLIGIAALLYDSFRPKPVTVDLAAVTRGPLEVTIDDDGRTRIKERYIVSTPLAGRLLRIKLDPGDSVTAGETILASLEPTDPALLDPRERAEAEARVRAAEAKLKQVTPLVATEQEDLKFAESELLRARKLHERGSTTQRDLDEKELGYRRSNHEYRATKFEEEIATFELQQAKAALLRTTRDSAEESDDWFFRIPAPITGRVLRVFQESATVVQAGERLMELGDPTDLEIEVDVLSTAAVRVRPGSRVRLEQWGGDEPLQGTVRLIEPSAFTKISALGVEEQRVNVIVDFDDALESRPNLGDGYRIEARIVIWENDNVLRVPTGALFRDGEQWAVFTTDHRRARLQPVSLGNRNALQAEVLDGLSEGAQVVLHASDRIADGVAIEPRDN